MVSIATYTTGLVLITLVWLCTFVFLGLALWEWRDRWSDVFPPAMHRQSEFIRDRSRFLFLLTFGFLLYFASIQRTIYILTVVMKQPVSVVAVENTIFILCIIALLTELTVQSRYMILRHRYFCVIGNSHWTKHIDPSMEHCYPLWRRYRHAINSNVLFTASVCLMFSLWLVMSVMFAKHALILRATLIGFAMLVCLGLLLLLRSVPENNTLHKYELTGICKTAVVFAVLGCTISPLISAVFNETAAVIFEQSIAIMFTIGIQMFIYVYIPKQMRVKLKDMELLRAGSVMRKTSRDVQRKQLYDIMSNINQLTDFMRFCKKNLCSENVVCLLELREFKLLIRKELGNVVESMQPVNSARSVTENDLFQVLSESERDTSPLPPTATTVESLSGTPHYRPMSPTETRKSGWDNRFTLDLSVLGCRSLIVDDPNLSLLQKAQALCTKYFDYSSTATCVNVKDVNRKQILQLIAQDSVFYTHPESIGPAELFHVFEGGVSDIFENLKQILQRFCAKRDIIKEVSNQGTVSNNNIKNNSDSGA